MADRYLARELIGPFFVGIFGFLLIQMSGVLMNLMRFMLTENVEIPQILRILAYRAPQFVVFALPVAVLFGVCLGINRMARENEITVMRLSGMPLRRIALPLLVVASLIATASFYLNETVVPQMNYRATMAEYNLFFRTRAVPIRADVFVGSGPYKFYIGEMEKTRSAENPEQEWYRLHRVMVYEIRPGQYPLVYTAESAEVKGTQWTLYRGVRRELDERGFTRTEVGYPKFTFDVDRTAGTLWSLSQTPEEMSAARLARAITEGDRSGNPNTRSWRVDYYLKFALPFACVVLALISLPLAVHFARGGGFTGVLIALLLFFFYVQGYLVFKELGNRILPPLLAAWSPNLAFAGIGAWLLWREE